MIKYDAFISYVSDDNNDGYLDDFIKQLRDSDDINVWYDKNEIKIADRWKIEIKKAIQNSLLFIPVITKHYIRKEWTQFELIIAKYNSKDILPLIKEEAFTNTNITNISKMILRIIKNLHYSNFNKEESIKLIKDKINSLKEKTDYKFFENDISFVDKVKHLYNKNGYHVQNYNEDKQFSCIKSDFIMIRSENKVKQEEIVVKCYDNPLLDNDIEALEELIECVNKSKIHNLRMYISKEFYVNFLKIKLDDKFSKHSIDIYDYFQILDECFQFNNYKKELEKRKDDYFFKKKDDDNLKNYKLSSLDNQIILDWYKKNESPCLIISYDKTDSIDIFNYHLTKNFFNHPHKYPLPVFIKCANYHKYKDLENIIFDELRIKERMKNNFYDLSKNKYQMVYIFDCLNLSHDNNYFKELITQMLIYKKAQKIIIICQKEYIEIIEKFNPISLNSKEKDIFDSIPNNYEFKYEYVIL